VNGIVTQNEKKNRKRMRKKKKEKEKCERGKRNV